MQEKCDNLEDAGNELILSDEEMVRFQIGEVFAHFPREEVETKIEEMKEATFKSLEKLQQEKESIVSRMAELKKVLYAKFKDSINLEEDWIITFTTKLGEMIHSSVSDHKQTLLDFY